MAQVLRGVRAGSKSQGRTVYVGSMRQGVWRRAGRQVPRQSSCTSGDVSRCAAGPGADECRIPAPRARGPRLTHTVGGHGTIPIFQCSLVSPHVGKRALPDLEGTGPVSGSMSMPSPVYLARPSAGERVPTIHGRSEVNQHTVVDLVSLLICPNAKSIQACSSTRWPRPTKNSPSSVPSTPHRARIPSLPPSPPVHQAYRPARRPALSTSLSTSILRLTVLSLRRIPLLHSESGDLDRDGLWLRSRCFIATRSSTRRAGDGALAAVFSPELRFRESDVDLHRVRPRNVPDSPVPPWLFVVASACFAGFRTLGRPLGKSESDASDAASGSRRSSLGPSVDMVGTVPLLSRVSCPAVGGGICRLKVSAYLGDQGSPGWVDDVCFGDEMGKGTRVSLAYLTGPYGTIAQSPLTDGEMQGWVQSSLGMTSQVRRYDLIPSQPRPLGANFGRYRTNPTCELPERKRSI